MKRTFAVYELSHGQPGRFWVSTGSFTPDIKKATLYTEKEATMVMKKLMQPRMANYQKTGKEYSELHIGDVYKKGLMENSIEKLRSVIREELERLNEGKVEDFLWAYGESGGKEIRKTGATSYDGDYANGWGKREFDLLKALKPFEVSTEEKEIGRGRHQIINVYKDGGKKWTITYKVDSTD